VRGLPPRGSRFGDPVRIASYGFAAFAGLVLIGMAAALALESVPAWRAGGIGFLAGKVWFYRAAKFGMLPMLYGSVAVAAIALAVAAPIGIGAALFTAEVLPRRARLTVKMAIELLAGVPSVVYGLLGVLLLRGAVYRLLAPWEPLSGDTLLTAGLLLAVMVLPTITTLADDALAGVPAAQRLAARSLGLNRAEVAWRVALTQALPGIASALVLGLGRALGETIAVFLVVGRQDNQWPERLLSLRPLAAAGQTITSKLGGSETFLAYGDPRHWGAITGLALVLFVAVLAVSLLGARLATAGGDRA
jgi:phosphate transport system permease protein